MGGKICKEREFPRREVWREGMMFLYIHVFSSVLVIRAGIPGKASRSE